MSRLYASLFYQKDVTDIFSDRSLLKYLMTTEIALAKAQALVGVIPQAAAQGIEQVCTTQGLEKLNENALATAGGLAGNIAIPFVKQLTALVKASDEDASRYVHWGATSQDVLDTACILQCRDALVIIQAQLEQAYDTALAQAKVYRHQIMMGRTWLQQALPITFGHKLARWASVFRRDLNRIEAMRARVLTAQLGGAVGSLASLNDQGTAVVAAFEAQLNLTEPLCTWHGERDRIVEIASVLGLVVGNLGKMARDWSLLMQTEVGEVFEPMGEGRGGSSTMPHKRNPVAAASVLAAANRVPVLISSLYQSMVQEHERSLGGWHAEWLSLPEIFQLCSGALERTLDVLQGMQVNPENMQRNLECTNGLVMAEAVMMRLAPTLGRLNAHHLVESACKKAVDEQRHLKDVIAELDDIRHQFTGEQISDMFRPESYIGNIQDQIDAVLNEAGRQPG
ncbi:3-carboxy-cis,cis-muconate cycloisomerase [Advenella mimigardefordensis]|uniref:3-carboxy-cis,cis-muconate cycloisomerase n=1 Tax=Advenella mimigardefordensis (strain DSM 17166 / LMG 22922 / DPN7) TaxID=1247726 RepID=W0PID5_ADVMD|nr:3-carboxy-cis,cis-muconate cycloisomerase [Advenella mimigardefordensis]AHG65642.1 3-carboxy-cis,cis-muconate cycloisomerase [Advenella mimigardefordensis DPN7]